VATFILLPNVLPIAIVLLGIDVGEAILRESALSYLGLGIQPPDASWGNMLSSAHSFFTVRDLRRVLETRPRTGL
jgi:peptide/nickel transport system permease protein